jgi:hypothetical protein
MRKVMQNRRETGRRKKVRQPKQVENRTTYKSPERLLKLDAGGSYRNLRVIERAGAPPVSKIVKAARANVHVHPRHKRNIHVDA